MYEAAQNFKLFSNIQDQADPICLGGTFNMVLDKKEKKWHSIVKNHSLNETTSKGLKLNVFYVHRKYYFDLRTSTRDCSPVPHEKIMVTRMFPNISACVAVSSSKYLGSEAA